MTEKLAEWSILKISSQKDGCLGQGFFFWNGFEISCVYTFVANCNHTSSNQWLLLIGTWLWYWIQKKSFISNGEKNLNPKYQNLTRKEWLSATVCDTYKIEDCDKFRAKIKYFKKDLMIDLSSFVSQIILFGPFYTSFIWSISYGPSDMNHMIWAIRYEPYDIGPKISTSFVRRIHKLTLF